MAGKSLPDDDKVMDVAKPGKGKIIGTSRPVITTSSASAQNGDASPITPDKEPEETLAPPSAKQKVLKPIEPVSISVKGNPTETPEPVDTEPVPGPVPEPSEEPADAPASEGGVSETAGVDELAKSVTDKKKAAEQARLEAERDQHVQELINSKKYAVPIGHSGSSGRSARGISLIIGLLLLVAGGYLLVDAEVVGKNIKLPYEFIGRESDAADMSAELDDAVADPADDTQPAATEKTDPPAGQKINPGATPVDRAEDDEAKNELKNLQQRLETYFNDNGDYPMSLTDLEPIPTADELQNSANESYTYTTDGESYILGTILADGSEYNLNSVNQSE